MRKLPELLALQTENRSLDNTKQLMSLRSTLNTRTTHISADLNSNPKQLTHLRSELVAQIARTHASLNWYPKPASCITSLARHKISLHPR
ncbi:Calcium-binding EF-hand family protein [Dorcoceras hygrometricum]|uniref:Calcium-binding EF-hand family protein n=1 Tax=Dorcoceras hygrometricum TaxID=472368 RepID=A0A2Z7D7M5_9LAMI|nr:Calcium-binding EF-hand family protein [Dorcoceras hygrometricum]